MSNDHKHLSNFAIRGSPRAAAAHRLGRPDLHRLTWAWVCWHTSKVLRALDIRACRVLRDHCGQKNAPLREAPVACSEIHHSAYSLPTGCSQMTKDSKGPSQNYSWETRNSSDGHLGSRTPRVLAEPSSGVGRSGILPLDLPSVSSRLSVRPASWTEGSPGLSQFPPYFFLQAFLLETS